MVTIFEYSWFTLATVVNQSLERVDSFDLLWDQNWRTSSRSSIPMNWLQRFPIQRKQFQIQETAGGLFGYVVALIRTELGQGIQQVGMNQTGKLNYSNGF